VAIRVVQKRELFRDRAPITSIINNGANDRETSEVVPRLIWPAEELGRSLLSFEV
jgi:hypothetical protein